MSLKRRKWAYIHNPKQYGIKCDICGKDNIEWSEFEHFIWCYNCEKDTKGNEGLFDGCPVPVNICKLMGISFDEVNLETGEIRNEVGLETEIQGNYIGKMQVKKS